MVGLPLVAFTLLQSHLNTTAEWPQHLNFPPLLKILHGFPVSFQMNDRFLKLAFYDDMAWPQPICLALSLITFLPKSTLNN